METAISVIVPVYRVEKYLPACIDSILNQTFTDFELILVDDGSPDRCPEICDETAKRDARVRAIHQANQGLSAARNAGIEAAHGAWLSFVDSDDFLAPDFLETLHDAAVRAGADCVLCGVQMTDEAGQKIGQPLSVADGVRTGRSILETLCRAPEITYLVAWNKLYRRDVFQTLRYPVGMQNEDTYLAAELFDTVQTVICVSKPMYFYRQRADSIMHTAVTTRNLDRMWAFEHCFAYFEARGLEALMPDAEKKMFAKLTGVYYRLPKEERQSDAVRQAKKAQWNAAMRLMKQGKLSARALARTLLFQALPGVYGLRMKR